MLTCCAGAVLVWGMNSIKEIYQDAIARATKLDPSAKIRITGNEAKVTYCGYVDYYTAGRLTHHLKAKA